MSEQLIICGMHRSGTSLVAAMLREAGLDIGHEEFGPGLGQPRGHFEDHDFYHLHEAMLAASGRSCFTADDAALADIDPVFAERARALVAAREDRPLWGWKEPRTCLFLDFWNQQLPRARFVFLYRHPVDVVLSLWRRNIDFELRRDPGLAFRAWELYNRRLLEFRDRHPDRCFLAHAPALVGDLPGFVRRVAAKLALPLREGGVSGAYVEDELAPSCPPPRPDWERLIPGALAIYRRLEECADLPSDGETLPAGRQRQLLQGSELLLHALLEARSEDGLERTPPELELRREYVRLRLQEESLRERVEGARARAQVLREIESSPSMSSPANQPVVSLILLSYNYERYIGDSVRSVLAQTYPHWELIVIDDASTDRSLEVVSSFSDKRIRVLRSAANSGPSQSYNLAYAGCRGQFIGSLDADDFLDPDKLALQVAAFEAEPDLDILGTFVTEVDDSGVAAAGGEVAAWFNQHRDLGAVENWLMRNHLCHSSVLVRRAAHERFGLLNPQLRAVADYELWLRALAQGARFRVLAQPLIFSRQHERNAWHGIGRLSQFLELAYLYSSQLAPHLVERSRLDLIAPCLAFFIRHFLEAASFQERRTAVRELGRFLDHPRDVAGFARAFESGCGEAWPAIVDAVESVPTGAA